METFTNILKEIIENSETPIKVTDEDGNLIFKAERISNCNENEKVCNNDVCYEHGKYCDEYCEHEDCDCKEEEDEELYITDVIFSEPATIVFWSDGSKTVVKAQNGEPFDKEKGLAMAIIKKLTGNTGAYNELFKEWC